MITDQLLVDASNWIKKDTVIFGNGMQRYLDTKLGGKKMNEI